MLCRLAISIIFANCLLVFVVGNVLAKPVVTNVRVGEHVGLSRVVLDITHEIGFDTFTLADPYRVVVDLSKISWEIPAKKNYQHGIISNLRFGHFTREISRMVIEAAGPVKVKRAFLLPPQGDWGYRFVIDVVSEEEQAFEDSVGKKKPWPEQVEQLSNTAKVIKDTSKNVIVIDAGHGGADPGAIGVSGSYEKIITLSAARELKQKLDKLNKYKVILTRTQDKFLKLRERVRIAREKGADLFISLHADSIRKRNVRGASVYTLSEHASDAEAAALAAKENKADIIGGMELSDETQEVASILIDLVQRETMNLSAGFANIVLPELGKHVRTLRNGHRFAGFAVLKAPDVPSVLVEMGYLSNRRDEKLLVSEDGRRPIIEALARAIDRYFEVKSE